MHQNTNSSHGHHVWSGSCVCSGRRANRKTHAQSESHKWKGIDVETVLGNDDYAPNPGELKTFSPRINKYPFEKGKIIFLYNVGTGNIY
jgi:hypothetical protein